MCVTLPGACCHNCMWPLWTSADAIISCIWEAELHTFPRTFGLRRSCNRLRDKPLAHDQQKNVRHRRMFFSRVHLDTTVLAASKGLPKRKDSPVKRKSTVTVYCKNRAPSPRRNPSRGRRGNTASASNRRPVHLQLYASRNRRVLLPGSLDV